MDTPFVERRKNGDRLLSRTEKLIAIGISLVAGLFFVFRVYAQSVDTAGLAQATKIRVDAIELVQPDLLYMACLSFRDAHANQLPASCDRAISRGPAR